MKIAALDIGSNSIHLLVTRLRPDHSYEVIYRDKAMVRLGDRTFARGLLSDAAQRRAILALERFAQIIRRFETDRTLAVATSAVREASNGTAFLREVRRRTGLKVDRISGAEEARLVATAVGALPEFHRGRHLVIDIGGGSTEMAFLEDEEPRHVESLKVGAVRLANMTRLKARPGKKGLKQLRAAAADLLGTAPRRLRGRTFDSVAGTSGTAVCLGMLALRDAGRPVPRGETFAVPRALLEAELEALASLTLDERRDYMGDQSPRADIILAGGAILMEILGAVDNRELQVPDRSIRDGVVVDFIRQKLEATPHDHLQQLARMAGGNDSDRWDPHTVRERSVVALARRYHYEPHHAHQVMKLAGQLFDATTGLHQLGADEKFFLEAAALLHDVGQYIAYNQHHRHSMYLILHGNLPGFSEREVALIANVARYHRKAIPTIRHPEFALLPTEDRATVRKLAALLRVADGLDDGHLSSIDRLRVEVRGKRVIVHVTTVGIARAELDRAGKKADLFEETFGRTLSFKARRRRRDGVHSSTSPAA